MTHWVHFMETSCVACDTVWSHLTHSMYSCWKFEISPLKRCYLFINLPYTLIWVFCYFRNVPSLPGLTPSQKPAFFAQTEEAESTHWRLLGRLYTWLGSLGDLFISSNILKWIVLSHRSQKWTQIDTVYHSSYGSWELKGK